MDELNCIDYILGRQQDAVVSLSRTQVSRSLQTVTEIVKERRATWASIAQTARTALEEIQSQMDLKQKQANLAELRSSRRQVSFLSRAIQHRGNLLSRNPLTKVPG